MGEGRPPLLRHSAPTKVHSQPAVAEATCHNRETPPTGQSPRTTGRSPEQEGGVHSSRDWSGPQQSYSVGARLLKGKLSNRNTSAYTQRPNRKASNYSDDRWINPQRWEENQCKKEANTRNQNTSPPTKDQNSSSAREQSWTENDCDEMRN